MRAPIVSWRYMLASVVLAPAVLIGCSARHGEPHRDYMAAKTAAPASAAAEAEGLATSGESADHALAGRAAPPPGDKIARKIIYSADVSLVVEQFDPVPEQVEQVVKQHGGYIAQSELTGSPGSRREGRWTLRVPAENYEACLVSVRGLGEPRRVRCDSQEVTEEFYDVESRIRNKKEEETQLRKHLEDSTGKLEEILQVEREISRVREEIERLEGRMRVLADLTTLATIRLSVEEIPNYVPEEAPTYATRVRRAWSGSIRSLVVTAENVSIAAVKLAPWIPMIIVAIVVLLWMFRRCCRAMCRCRQ